jgi:hypothetical protein
MSTKFSQQLIDITEKAILYGTTDSVPAISYRDYEEAETGWNIIKNSEKNHYIQFASNGFGYQSYGFYKANNGKIYIIGKDNFPIRYEYSPLNNFDDRFSIISGIVDTDTFPNEINFPIVINGDKYPILETTIKKGTPYVQIIPFKRDSWKMIVKSRAQKEIQNSRLFYGLKLLNIYKEKYWNKKSWK